MYRATNISLLVIGALFAAACDPSSMTDDGGVTDARPPDGGAPSRHVVVRLLGPGHGSVDGGPFDCAASGGAACVADLPDGSALHLEAHADADSRLAGWSVTECGAGPACDVTVNADTVVEVTFELSPVTLTVVTAGDGVVAVAPPGEDCSGECVHTYPSGATVVLTAAPGADHRFGGWTDDCAETTGPVCTLTLTADARAGAAFVPLEDGITAIRAGTGDGTVTSTPAGIDCGTSCEHVFSRGTAVTLEATAAAGSDFEGWSGDCAGTATCDLVVSGGHVAVASFRRRRYTLSVATTSDGSGRVLADIGGLDCGPTCAVEYGHGEVVTLTATPDASSSFAGWGGACASAGTSPTCAVTVTAATDVTASFALHTYPLDVTPSGSGGGVVTSSPAGIDCGSDCDQIYGHGEAVTLTATPDAGSVFAGWSGACSGSSSTCVVDMLAARSVGAAFDGTPRTLTVALIGGGAATVTSSPSGIDCGSDCSETWLDGTSVTLDVAVAAGSTFAGWVTGDSSCATAGPCTITLDRDRTISADVRPDVATRLSDTDRDPDVRLRDDRLAVDFYVQGGVRSDRAVAPGSGVFYFEAHRLSDATGPYGFGVATAAAPIVGAGSYVGATDQSFGADVGGGMSYDDTWLGAFASDLTDHYGFVVDYRGATPTVHFIAMADLGSGPVATVVHSQAMAAVTTPLYIQLAGTKRTIGYELEINPGNDTTNFPFFYDPDAVLRGEGMGAVADALVLGWGDTFARAPDDAPVLTPSSDVTVPAGAPVTVTVTATDTEDGDLTPDVTWELLSTPYYADRLTGSGGSFTFTPDAVGVHPARAWVRDSAGQLTEVVVEVTVAGPVTQYDPVRLEPDALTGAGIILSPDGLSARYTGLGKMGIRANQSNYGRFWYFEIERLVAPRNQGGGLVVGNGDLNPYDWDYVAQSCSINNGGGVWRNIMWQANWPDPDASTYTHYGFAVDYRGAHPIVYVILDGAVVHELYLDDVWTEIYPMLYGNPSSTAPGAYDEAINFGATAFTHDATAALSAYGVDVTGFEPGWGDANLP